MLVIVAECHVCRVHGCGIVWAYVNLWIDGVNEPTLVFRRCVWLAVWQGQSSRWNRRVWIVVVGRLPLW